jgi:hypothetical protein
VEATKLHLIEYNTQISSPRVLPAICLLSGISTVFPLTLFQNRKLGEWGGGSWGILVIGSLNSEMLNLCKCLPIPRKQLIIRRGNTQALQLPLTLFAGKFRKEIF